MKTNIIIVCEACGKALNVTDTVCDMTNQIKFTVQPCDNKECNKEFCDDCEDVQDLNEKVEMYEQRIKDANLISMPGERNFELIEYPLCFGKRDIQEPKCKDDCGYVEKCIEKTALS